jgi:hypothetical protein
MPRTNVNFHETVIYKIVCNDTRITDVYVGHTTNFTQRKNHHKTSSLGNIPQSRLKLYTFINDHGGWNNWNMIEIEKYPCSDGNEACARERHHYELLNSTLNDRSPHKRLITNSVRAKAWRTTNSIKTCTCGKEITGSNMSRHKKICIEI